MNQRVALLRGVNVGGHKKIAMARLATFFSELGLAEPQTLLQSGNVTFRSDRGPAQLEALLEVEGGRRLGLETLFFVRTPEEWREVVARNPFPEAARRDPSHLLVVFLKDAPDPATVRALQAAITGPEQVRAWGRQAYITFPAGIGDSRLSPAAIDRGLRTRGTGRNWNTVQKLAARLGAAGARP